MVRAKATGQQEKVETSDKQKAFMGFLTSMNKKFEKVENGDNIVQLFSDVPDVERVSTGLMSLDAMLRGGIAVGRFTEIYGKESSGKSTIALKILATRQKMGRTALYIDTENAIVPEYAESLGVDLSNAAISQPTTAENALNLALQAARSGVVDTIILDSIAALVPKKELEGDMDDQTVGLLARLMSKFLRQMTNEIRKNNVDFIGINQQRVKIGGFSPMGEQVETTGGKAPKYYASLRLSVSGKRKTESSKPVGIDITLRSVKCKTAPPFREAVIPYNFETGFDNIQMVADASIELKVVAPPEPGKKKLFFKATGEEMSPNGKPTFVERLRNEPELLLAVEKECFRVLNESTMETTVEPEDYDENGNIHDDVMEDEVEFV